MSGCETGAGYAPGYQVPVLNEDALRVRAVFPRARAGAAGEPACPRILAATIPDGAFTGRPEFERLSAEERLALDGMSSAKRRVQFACGRLLLRRALREALGPASESLRIGVRTDGSLLTSSDGGAAPPGISLSHSRHVVLCGVGANAVVGVDVECCVPRKSAWEDLAAQALHPIERDRLARLAAGGRWRGFYRAWTLKEAWAKALGLGLALPFREIAFSRDDRIEIAPDREDLEHAGWRFASFDVAENVVGAVAWRAA